MATASKKTATTPKTTSTADPGPSTGKRTTASSKKRRGDLGIMEITPKVTGVTNRYELHARDGFLLVQADRINPPVTGDWKYKDTLTGIESSWADHCFRAIELAEKHYAKVEAAAKKSEADKTKEREEKAAARQAAKAQPKAETAPEPSAEVPVTEPVTEPVS